MALLSFDSFINKQNNSLLENAENRAKRKLERANKLLQKAQDAIESGNEERANKLIARANSKIDRAEELDSNIDLDQVKTLATDIAVKTGAITDENGDTIKNEINDEDDEVNKDSLSDETIKKSSNIVRDKIKITDFDFINKIKIVGDGISPEENAKFLESAQEFLLTYWEQLQRRQNIPKTYQTSNGLKLIIKVEKSINRIVVEYKEGWNDKIKLILSFSDFDKDINKESINKEVQQVIDSEELNRDVIQNYDKLDDKDITNSTTQLKEEPIVGVPSATTIAKVEQLTLPLIQKDPSFIKQSVDFFVSQKLNIGSENTDEDEIVNYIKTNTKKFLNIQNTNTILIDYRKAKSFAKESLITQYNNKLNEWSLSDLADSGKRAMQSVITTKSNGLISDLINAFNSDSTKISSDINKILNDIKNAYQIELNKTATDLTKKNESLDMMPDMSTIGMMISSVMAWKSVKYLKTIATNPAVEAAAKPVVGRGIMGSIGSGALTVLCSPWFYVPALLAIASYGSYKLYQSFDEQQYQIAIIILILWSSGSEEVIKEMKQNHINITIPKVDISKMQEIVKQYNSESETVPTNETVSTYKLFSFEEFINLKK